MRDSDEKKTAHFAERGSSPVVVRFTRFYGMFGWYRGTNHSWDEEPFPAKVHETGLYHRHLPFSFAYLIDVLCSVFISAFV
jgi:hypothetical protein